MAQTIYEQGLNINPFMSLASAKKCKEHYAEIKLICCKVAPEKTNARAELSKTTGYVFIYNDLGEHYLVDEDGIHELSLELFESFSECQNNEKCELNQPSEESCKEITKELSTTQ